MTAVDRRAARRRFLRQLAAVGAASLAAPLGARAQPIKFSADPFTLGVASGSPRRDGFVLWTRLAPTPLAGGGLEPVPVEVGWEVAEDEGFKRIVKRGRDAALPKNAHAVHVEVDGLRPGRPYFYRFTAADAVSPIARTRTAPEAGRGDDRLRLALASCQQYEQGYYVAHRHLAREDADLVCFVGDYIYESSWGRDPVRKHGTAEPATLAEYRDRYALYKGDGDLQKSHAACPWIVTWDDHEVDNDYADDRSEELDPAFLVRRAAAYKAFVEHMPLRRSVLLRGGGVRLYDRHEWGTLAAIHLLDLRQYRSHQVCTKPYRGGSNVVGPECTERHDPALTLMGLEQERWLDEGLERSRAHWNVIAQTTLMAPAARRGKQGLVHWTDGWDGYPAARRRLYDAIEKRKPSNPMVLGGDVHATYFAELHRDPDDSGSPVLAAEICGTSISSQGPAAATVQGIRESNPHIRYANAASRGYVLVEITRERAEARLRAVETVKRDESPIATTARAVIESGRPGLIVG